MAALRESGGLRAELKRSEESRSSDARRQRIYHWIGRIYSRILALARRWGRSFDALSFDDTPFTPLRKPLRECRFALITTGGVHLRDQPPYDMADPRGDPTYRSIPRTPATPT